jgi:hypothetical protein
MLIVVFPQAFALLIGELITALSSMRQIGAPIAVVPIPIGSASWVDQRPTQPTRA